MVKYLDFEILIMVNIAKRFWGKNWFVENLEANLFLGMVVGFYFLLQVFPFLMCLFRKFWLIYRTMDFWQRIFLALIYSLKK